MGTQRTGRVQPIQFCATWRLGMELAAFQVAWPFFTAAAPTMLMGFRLARSAASMARANSFMSFWAWAWMVA